MMLQDSVGKPAHHASKKEGLRVLGADYTGDRIILYSSCDTKRVRSVHTYVSGRSGVGGVSPIPSRLV